jgi:hypothetical protein
MATDLCHVLSLLTYIIRYGKSLITSYLSSHTYQMISELYPQNWFPLRPSKFGHVSRVTCLEVDIGAPGLVLDTYRHSRSSRDIGAPGLVLDTYPLYSHARSRLTRHIPS